MDIYQDHPRGEIQKIEIKRLSMNLPLTFHNSVKSRAAQQGLSITQYIMKAVYERMKSEKE